MEARSPVNKLFKPLLKPLLNRKGNAIALILSLGVVAGVVCYIGVNAIRKGQDSAISEDRMVEAETMATDFLEITKYLLFYEKIIYIDSKGPLDHSGSRGTQLLTYLQQGLGVTDLNADVMKACGGYDGKGRQIGEYQIGGANVFCPFYLRSNMFSGNMLEQMVLEPMVTKGIIKSSKPGQYEIELVFFDRTKNIDNISSASSNFVGYNIGQDLLNSVSHRVESVKTTIKILTNQAGFASATSERFIEVSSEVILGSKLKSYPVTKRESFITYPSTPKDFALFMMFPTDSSFVKTTKWSQAVKLPAGSTVEGRVFFNGDIDSNLADLPVFNEIVVISGDLTSVKTKADRDNLKTKFLKGIITNYSAARFLQTGTCSITDPTINFVNSTGYQCSIGNDPSNPYKIEYLPAKGLCFSYKITYKALPDFGNKVGVEYDCSKASPADPNCDQNSGKCKNGSSFITGVQEYVESNAQVTFVAGAISKLLLHSNYMYGTMMGGYLESTVKIAIKSMSATKIGDPGIGSQETLDGYSVQFQQAFAGISSPLTNLPIVFVSGGSR